MSQGGFFVSGVRVRRLGGASDGDFVVGYALSAAPRAPRRASLRASSRRRAACIESYAGPGAPQNMYDRTVVIAEAEDGTEVRREYVRGLRLKSGDWLKREEDRNTLASYYDT